MHGWRELCQTIKSISVLKQKSSTNLGTSTDHKELEHHGKVAYCCGTFHGCLNMALKPRVKKASDSITLFIFVHQQQRKKIRAHNNMIDSILLMEKREKNSVI